MKKVIAMLGWEDSYKTANRANEKFWLEIKNNTQENVGLDLVYGNKKNKVVNEYRIESYS